MRPQLGLDAGELAAAGIAAAYALTDIEPDDLAECMAAAAGPLLERLGARIAREQLG